MSQRPQRPQRPQRRPSPIALSLSRYYGDGKLIRVIDVYPHAQNLTTFINVFWMAEERMNSLKSNHGFNVESRHGHHCRRDGKKLSPSPKG